MEQDVKCEWCESISHADEWKEGEIETDPDECTCGYHTAYVCPSCNFHVDSINDSGKYKEIESKKNQT